MPNNERPNILFLFAEDMRADTISSYGNSQIRTPHLDGLVARGFSFRQNYCAGSNSGAVCIPSRAMLMSGKYWMHTNNELDGEFIFPELFRQNGYTTFITGKWHNQKASALRGFERGKALFLGGMSDHTRVPVQDICNGECSSHRYGEKFSSELFADAAVEFLTTYDEDRPFLAYAAFTAPHDPRQPPEVYRQEYYDNLPPLPPNFLPQHPFDNGQALGGRDEDLGSYPRTEDVIRGQLAEYYGMVTHLDEQIGRILQSLEQSGRASNTIIIFGVDHGLAMGSHGLLGKQNVYEHSMRVPLIFSGPGIPERESTRALTYLLDIYPTMCSLAGIEAPSHLEGHNLCSIWDGESQKVRDTVFLPYMNLQRAVRNERWKLICYPQINHHQLFDLENDPNEINNLAEDPAFAGGVESMLSLMKEYQEKLGDEQPLSVLNPKPKELEPGGHICVPDRYQPEWIRDKYFGGAGFSEKDLQMIAEEEKVYG